MLEPPARLPSDVPRIRLHWAARQALVDAIQDGTLLHGRWADVHRGDPRSRDRYELARALGGHPREVAAAIRREAMPELVRPAVESLRAALSDLGAAAGLPPPLQSHFLRGDGSIVEHALINRLPERDRAVAAAAEL